MSRQVQHDRKLISPVAARAQRVPARGSYLLLALIGAGHLVGILSHGDCWVGRLIAPGRLLAYL